MPNDSVHVIFNFLAYIIISIIYFAQPLLTLFQFIIFSFMYALGTLVLNPDLDTKSKAGRRCGVLCVPYRAVFSHRKTSHHWLLGTATRIVYVILVAIIILIILGVAIRAQDITGLLRLVGSYKLEVLSAILGLFLSNFLHIILDRATS